MSTVKVNTIKKYIADSQAVKARYPKGE